MIDLFSNLFENDTDQFLFGNLDRLPRSTALFLRKLKGHCIF